MKHELLSRVIGGLSGVLGVAESADVAPTPDVMTVAERWIDASSDALGRSKHVLERDLAELNAELKQPSLKPLATPLRESPRN